MEHLGLSLCEATSAVGAINSRPTSATLCIACSSPSGVDIFFSNSTVVHTKMGHVSKIVITLARLCTKLRTLASAIHEIWMGHSKFKTCNVT